MVYANTLLLDSSSTKSNINNIHLAAIYVGIGNTGMEEGREVNPDKWKSILLILGLVCSIQVSSVLLYFVVATLNTKDIADILESYLSVWLHVKINLMVHIKYRTEVQLGPVVVWITGIMFIFGPNLF